MCILVHKNGCLVYYTYFNIGSLKLLQNTMSSNHSLPLSSNSSVGGNDGVYKAIGVTAAVGAVAFVYWYTRKPKPKNDTNCYKKSVSWSLPFYIYVKFDSAIVFHILLDHCETKYLQCNVFHAYSC